MSLRFVIARFQHETNTFSPIKTPLESFYPQWGADALTNQTGARTAMAALLMQPNRLEPLFKHL